MLFNNILENYTLWTIIIALVSSLITGFLSLNLHDEKGYSGGFWIGFLLGVIGLIYAAGRPNAKQFKITETNDGNKIITVVNENETATEETEVINICPKCGWQVLPEDEECSKCGNNLKVIVTEENEVVNICPECGWQVFPEDKECSKCGHKF